MKYFVRFFLLLSFLLIFSSSEAFACTCKRAPNLSERDLVIGSFDNADFVFTGRVVRVFQKEFREGKQAFLEGEKTVVIEIADNFKDKVQKKKVTLKTGMGYGDCGIPFKTGEKYLVYASFVKVFDSKNRFLRTEIHTKDCSRTSLLSKANSDIEIIKQILSAK